MFDALKIMFTLLFYCRDMFSWLLACGWLVGSCLRGLSCDDAPVSGWRGLSSQNCDIGGIIFWPWA